MGRKESNEKKLKKKILKIKTVAIGIAIDLNEKL